MLGGVVGVSFGVFGSNKLILKAFEDHSLLEFQPMIRVFLFLLCCASRWVNEISQFEKGSKTPDHISPDTGLSTFSPATRIETRSKIHMGVFIKVFGFWNA